MGDMYLTLRHPGTAHPAAHPGPRKHERHAGHGNVGKALNPSTRRLRSLTSAEGLHRGGHGV